MTKLIQKALAEIQKLDASHQDMLAVRILQIIDTQDYLFDDDDDVGEVLNDFVNEDGSIDFEKLNVTSITLTLEELCEDC
jgi:hypothetical protein